MRILLLTNNTNTTGGSGRNAANLVTALRGAGYEVRSLGFRKNFIGFVLRACWEARTVDAVQAVDVNPVGFAGYIATRFSRVKFILLAQAAYSIAPLYHRKTALASRLVYHAADAIVAGSTYVAQEIQKALPGYAVTVIDPGIDLSKFRRGSSVVAHAAAPYLLSVGAVKNRKGHHVSLRAFAQAKKQIPQLRYIIVGSRTEQPGYFHELVRLADELAVTQDVEFLSNISDEELNALYDNAALFILTSINDGHHFEGFGMVFLEAAAHGVPAVGTRDNGIADAVEEGGTGFLVPQNNVSATTAAILRILTDPALAERMRTRAIVFAREHDITHITHCYEKLYGAIFTRTHQ